MSKENAYKKEHIKPEYERKFKETKDRYFENYWGMEEVSKVADEIVAVLKKHKLTYEKAYDSLYLADARLTYESRFVKLPD
jgi:hypothetical protein